jgi:hypothetical protein
MAAGEIEGALELFEDWIGVDFGRCVHDSGFVVNAIV